MIVPQVPTRVEQRDDAAGVGVDGRDVWSLLQVATHTAEAEVLELVGAAVLPTDDVIDLVGQQGRSLRQPAVLARALRTSLDGGPNVRR